MAKEYLDKSGLTYLWGKIKAYVQAQIQAVGAITGVKGNAESTYRTGNVNLTPANIGAVPNYYGTTLSNVFPQGFTGADSIKVGLTGSVKATSQATENTQYLFGARPTAPVLYNDTNGTVIWTGYTDLRPPTASDVGAVPTTRTVNSKALSSNISLDADDVGALPISGGTLTGPLKVEGHSTQIGWYDAHYNTNTLNSVSSFTAIDASAITLPIGRYVVTGTCSFGANTSGIRGIGFTTGTSVMNESSVCIPPVTASGWNTRVSSSLILNITSESTVKLMYLQNTGSSLSINWYIKAIRIV